MKKTFLMVILAAGSVMACSKKNEAASEPADESTKSIPAEKAASESAMRVPAEEKVPEKPAEAAPASVPAVKSVEPALDPKASGDASAVKDLEKGVPSGQEAGDKKEKADSVLRAPSAPPALHPRKAAPKPKAVGFHQMDEEEPTQE